MKGAVGAAVAGIGFVFATTGKEIRKRQPRIIDE
jgi:hypothetical protein